MFKNRSRIMAMIWATLLLAAGFGLWHILPNNIRNQVEPTAHAATFTVNSADDHNDGVCNAADCTLREAIIAANAGDTISFNIPGSGVHTINATNGFGITKAIIIDGTSQPGFAGAPLIEINGAGAGAAVNGLSVNAPKVTIKGLIINRFSGYGINFDSFGNSSVYGCYIGTNAAGTAASANVAGGIRINAPNITIGGGNVISGNKGNGIDVVSGGATILGNFIGTNATGNGSVLNTGDGVNISGSAEATIGGTVAGARNIICSGGSGIAVSGGSATIQSNFIGLFVSGNNGPGNGVSGINIKGGSVTVGGTASGAGNVIFSNIIDHMPGGSLGPDVGAGVYIGGGTGSVVQGNLIGTTSAGTAIFPPSEIGNLVGVLIDGAANNVIGGTSSGARNVISRNLLNIHIVNAGATNNVIQGNFIGTDATGNARLTNTDGVVLISPGPTNNLIGGTVPGARNVIADTISIFGGSGTHIEGNYIGLNAAGTASIGKGVGVEIDGGSAIVGGTTAGAGNVISGHTLTGSIGTGVGVYIRGGSGSQVLGNFIGTNPAGTAKIPNRLGVIIDGAANNVIGGTTPAARNVISGNTEIGVGILNAGAMSNVVQGNFIGTDVNGASALGNGNGVEVRTGAQNSTIGGTATGAGNVISGNNGSGVAVTGGSGTSILGNFIGTNAAGTQGISNGGPGVNISGGSAVVGGTPGSRNVISGNNSGIVFGGIRPAQALGVRAGVLISGGSGSQVVGNSIGTDASGTGIIPNDSGVVIEGAANNLIGVTIPAGGNVIKGNVFDGVHIEGPQATNNIVQSNLIASNGFNGVAISDGASNNKIGGTVLRAGNTITDNGHGGFAGSNGGGVRIDGGTGNAVLGNSIYANDLLGIDLGGRGVTANDNCESAVGPNINPQNFPVITSASADSTTTTIRGTLNSTPNSQFRIEFFANAACDSSGNGQGQTYFGFVNTTTDASCNANFSFSLPNALVTGPIITATATDSNNNTSEFSACATPMGVLPTIQFSAASYTIGEGDRQVDIPITRSGNTSAAASVSFATSDLAGTQRCNITIGVASSRCDYETRLATVRFAPGETSKTISVLIIDDSYLEGPETFNIRLTNPVGAFVGAPAEATVTITDNDLATGPNLIDAPGVFVRAHYLDFLNREPDQSGFDFWTNQITSCGLDQACIQLRRINVSAAFFRSLEFQQTGYFVERIYKTAFGDYRFGFSTVGGAHQVAVPSLRLDNFLLDTQRIGEGVIVGQSGWEAVLENNKRAFTLDFAQGSSRFFWGNTTPAQYVDQLFSNAGFTPSEADRNAAIAEFGGAANAGDAAARARALRDVTENPILIQQEFNRAFVLMEYFGYLRRNPNDLPDTDYTGYDFWLTKLNQFNGDFQKSEMVKAFINSSEYRNRFGP